ncbi:MAG: hypothetical protein R3C56_16785 [Pirellulaceae bacterium]
MNWSHKFYRINTQGMPREAALQQIGLGVAADYVFWGTLVPGSPDKVESGILDTKTGKIVAVIPGGMETKFPVRAQLCSKVLDALAQSSKQSGDPWQLARVQRRFQTRLLASTEEVERLIISARGRIADAMQLELGQGTSQQLWEEAKPTWKLPLSWNPTIPLSMRLANVYFGQFQILQAGDDPAAAASGG